MTVFLKIGEDEQGACIHCGEVWYLKHYADGVCHKCQELGKPGRSVIAARKRIRQYVVNIGMLVVFFVLFAKFLWPLFQKILN